MGLHIVQQHCQDLLTAPAMVRLSEAPQLAPAVVARAAQVVRSIHGALDGSAREQALERLVNNTLQAQGHAPIRRHDPARLPELYDPNFLNADSDLSAIAQGIAHNRSARLCLYGPPGTGKTAYGRWLAQTLEMVQNGRVCSVDGQWTSVQAQTVCLHGDGEHALAFARRLRNAFMTQGIVVQA